MCKVLLKKYQTCPEKNRDIRDNTLDYFQVNNPKLWRFYLLPKIHKSLQNVPGRPVYIIRKTFQPSLSLILNLWHKKLNLIPPLPDHILCTMDIVALYPDIRHN